MTLRLRDGENDVGLSVSKSVGYTYMWFIAFDNGNSGGYDSNTLSGLYARLVRSVPPVGAASLSALSLSCPAVLAASASYSNGTSKTVTFYAIPVLKGADVMNDFNWMSNLTSGVVSLTK